MVSLESTFPLLNIGIREILLKSKWHMSLPTPKRHSSPQNATVASHTSKSKVQNTYKVW